VIQLSPPLVVTREHIDEAVAILDRVLSLAEDRMRLG
jgi:4-aminobutyrate aminotransferase-like enzyme